MKKRIAFLLLFGILLTTLWSFQNKPMTLTYQDYETEWKIIDSLEEQGLPKSALEKVNALYERAKSEDNAPQFVKTIIYKSKYTSQLEEEGLAKAITLLEEETEAAKFPVQPILQSMLAELYSQYLQNNIWQIRNRTETTSQSDDMKTWSVERLTAKSAELYQASVQNEKLKDISLDTFKAILTEGKLDAALRPTLYDFLAHRAIDYFTNERSYLTEPAYKFYINDPKAFAEAKTFINTTFETQDKTSAKYQALALLQDILKFHSNDSEPAAFVDADLKRLRFVHQNATLDNKDELYLSALDDLSRKYPNNPITAEVLYYKALFYSQRAEQYQPKPEGEQDDAKFDFASAVELSESIIKMYPNSYGAQHAQSLLTQIQRKEMNFQVEEVNLPDQPFLAYVEYRNISKAYFKIIKLDEEADLNNKNFEEQIQWLNKQKTVKSWSVVLPPDKDYRQHSAEVMVEKLPLGKYVLLVSANEKFAYGTTPTGFAVTQVSNMGYWNRQSEQAEFVVMNRQTGQPLEGVTADFYTREYNYTTRKSQERKIASTTSDKNGFVRPKVKDNQYYIIKFRKGDDVLDFGDGFSNYSQNNQQQGYNSVHFFTDRAIYRPGQTVYFKGIAMNHDKDGKPSILKNQKVSVTFFDVNYQEVEKLELLTNEYGTISGQFTTPKTGLLGQMHLYSDLGESRQYFQVEEYKRPKFEVAFDPIKESYRLDEKVTVNGYARAFAGSNVDGAQLQYRVVREVRFPWMPWWYSRYLPVGNSMEIANGTATTDAEGKFQIKFTALPDRSLDAKNKPEFVYTVYADVTDITGETHSNQTTVKVGYVALDITLNIAEQVNRDSFTALDIIAKNLNGEVISAQGTVTIEQLEMPKRTFIERYWPQPDKKLLPEATFVKNFPHLAYDKENEMQNWKVVKQHSTYQFDSDSKLQLGTPLQPGAYVLTLKTQDRYNTPVELKKYFTVYDIATKAIPTTDVAEQILPKQQHEPGETAHLFIATPENNVHVLYEIERNGNITSSQWVTVDGVKELTQQVTENERGNFHIHLSYVKFNRSNNQVHTIIVPWSNKDLTIEYGTFRDKLQPGAEEEWQIKISGPKGEKVAAEMVATMYDASLDQFVEHNWSFNPYPVSGYAYRRLSSQHFNSMYGRVYNPYDQSDVSNNQRIYRQLNWFNFNSYGDDRVVFRSARGREMAQETISYMSAPPPMAEMADSDLVMAKKVGGMVGNAKAKEQAADGSAQKESFGDVKVRTNLNETVFFLPELSTDAEGNVIVKFKMNEALTKWKFLGFAHTEDLKFGLTEKEIVTQKELMVLPNPPRFMREDDEIEFTAKVSNLTEKELTGTAIIQLFDATTMQPVDDLFGLKNAEVPFTAKAGQSARLAWNLEVPSVAKVSGLVHRVVAKSGTFSDGEEDALPILTNRMLVTETLPLPVRGKKKEEFVFVSLKNSGASNTLEHQSFSLEFTSNPAWYAVQALPYLMEYPYECIEQQFNRYYANALATTVANAHPQIRQVFEKWKASDAGAMASNLSKNQELKSALLEETPWVLQAQSEEEQKRNIALLFDLNRMADEQQATLNKILERQSQSGGFAWFPGGEENWYMTQYIVEGLAHLQKLGVKELGQNQRVQEMLQRAVQFIDAKFVEHYEQLQRSTKNANDGLTKDNLDPISIHYLYTRSFFKEQPMSNEVKKAQEYYLAQAEKYWLGKGIYQEGMLALALQRFGKTATPPKIVKSLKERAIRNNELGMYWKYDVGYFWYQLPVETQSLMVEVFDEVAKDAEAVEELKIWLLKTKQTTHWKTTKATSAAVYALLMSGDNWLLENQPVEITFENTGNPEIHSAKIREAQNTAEAGTGYFKTTWSANEITPEMATIEVKNPNKTVAWGGAYWQYFEQLDKIKTFEETPLTIKKQLFKENNTARGPILEVLNEGATLKPGDKLKVRIELRVDRPMEYVHMKDMRASGFEPINVLSQYKWQDGLGYYESTGDVATNFFFSFLPAGTYVFEYPMRVVHGGDFSNGVTTIQCMYAPEFTSHSEGIRVKVK